MFFLEYFEEYSVEVVPFFVTKLSLKADISGLVLLFFFYFLFLFCCFVVVVVVVVC